MFYISRVHILGIVLAGLSAVAPGCAIYTVTLDANLAMSATLAAESSSSSVGIPDEARRVAFVPPDRCASTDRIGYGKEQALIQVECGAWMAELENQASSRGWEVFGWRGLDGSDPLSSAREEGVDILVQINDLARTRVAPDWSEELQARFVRVNRKGATRGSWRVREDYAPVCADRLNTAWPAALYTVGLDAQLISVRTAQVLHHHRSVFPFEGSTDISGSVHWRGFFILNRGRICVGPPNFTPNSNDGRGRSSRRPRSFVTEVALNTEVETVIDRNEQELRHQVGSLVSEFVELLGTPSPR
jgi:hypothetical protein